MGGREARAGTGCGPGTLWVHGTSLTAEVAGECLATPGQRTAWLTFTCTAALRQPGGCRRDRARAVTLVHPGAPVACSSAEPVAAMCRKRRGPSLLHWPTALLCRGTTQASYGTGTTLSSSKYSRRMAQQHVCAVARGRPQGPLTCALKPPDVPAEMTMSGLKARTAR